MANATFGPESCGRLWNVVDRIKRPELRCRVDGEHHTWLRQQVEERGVSLTWLVNKALRLLRKAEEEESS